MSPRYLRYTKDGRSKICSLFWYGKCRIALISLVALLWTFSICSTSFVMSDFSDECQAIIAVCDLMMGYFGAWTFCGTIDNFPAHVISGPPAGWRNPPPVASLRDLCGCIQALASPGVVRFQFPGCY